MGGGGGGVALPVQPNRSHYQRLSSGYIISEPHNSSAKALSILNRELQSSFLKYKI